MLDAEMFSSMVNKPIAILGLMGDQRVPLVAEYAGSGTSMWRLAFIRLRTGLSMTHHSEREHAPLAGGG